MPRAYLCFTLSPAVPALTGVGEPARLSPFGQWLRGRIALDARRWGAVTFERLRFSAREVRLVVLLHDFALPLVVTVAVSHALLRETEAAARRAGWLPEGGRMWSAGTPQVWCSEHFPGVAAAAGGTPWSRGTQRPARRVGRSAGYHR
jgi:hypothetical protein